MLVIKLNYKTENYIWRYAFDYTVSWKLSCSCRRLPRVASLYQIMCKYLHPVKIYLHMKYNMAAISHLGFVGGTAGPLTNACSWWLFQVKISLWPACGDACSVVLITTNEADYIRDRVTSTAFFSGRLEGRLSAVFCRFPLTPPWSVQGEHL